MGRDMHAVRSGTGAGSRAWNRTSASRRRPSSPGTGTAWALDAAAGDSTDGAVTPVTCGEFDPSRRCRTDRRVSHSDRPRSGSSIDRSMTGRASGPMRLATTSWLSRYADRFQ